MEVLHVRCCTDENWDEWQQPARDELEAEHTEEQTHDHEPHCDDPDFIVCSIYQLFSIILQCIP